MSDIFPSALSETIGNTGVDGGTLKTVAGVATGVGLAVKAVVSVGEEEMGVRTRFKKARVHRRGPKKGQHIIVGPGPHLTFPGVHSIRTINVNDRSTDLEDLILDIQPDSSEQPEQFRISSSAVWRVSKEDEGPYQALYETTTLEETVTNVCVNGLLTACRNVQQITELYDSERMFYETNQQCAERLMAYGVVLTGLYLTSVARTEAQVLANAIRESSVSLNNIIAAAGALDLAGLKQGNGNGNGHTSPVTA